jgi:3-oxoacyl-[acyl-carrier protein] reductase
MTSKFPAPFDGVKFLTGRVALVTGGSSGIGAAIAKGLAEAGASVAVVASSGKDKAARVAEAIVTAGGKAAPFVADVRDEKAVAALVQSVEQSLGPIDVLVNSAGVYYATPVGNTPRADLDRMVDINLKGTWNMISAVAPGMKARRFGKIVNMSSVAAFVGLGQYPIYCATKAGIMMLTKALARDLAPFDVNINAIAPGNTATPMNEDVRENDEALEFMKRVTPSTTSFSAPEEIASTALYLVSPASRPMHGSTLLIDEGLATGI